MSFFGSAIALGPHPVVILRRNPHNPSTIECKIQKSETMEDATMSTTCAGKKRTAEGIMHGTGSATSATNSARGREDNDLTHDEQSQQRSAKKPKLSKKEMLLAAKARLKEAQEKQKSLLQSLQEQKQKEQEQQKQDGEGVEDTNNSSSCKYNDDTYYYYEYMYHIPPVTGSRDTLVVTDITSTGPEEKVRFLPEKQVGIESLMRVIQSRSRGISPTPIGISTGGGSGKQKDSRPGSRGVSPTPMTVGDTTTGDGTSDTAQQNNGHARPKQHENESVTAPGLSHGQQRAQDKSNLNSVKKRLPDRSLQSSVDGKHVFGDAARGGATMSNADRSHPPLPPNSSTRSFSRSHVEATLNANRNGHGGDDPSNSRLQDESLGKRPLFRGTNGTDHKRLPDRALKKVQNAESPLPPKVPTNPLPRPWKRALAHITGKTLNCDLDLPSNASYLIRTQDRSVLTRVRFLSAPDNAALLKKQRQKSTRDTPFHLSPLDTLPCKTSYAWKGVDILLFLQNQDQQRNNQKRTYLPPARRNLPLSHWAILELQHPFLPPHQQPLGCFTATLQSDKQQHTGNKHQQQQQDDKKGDIHFAGKLVWNMTLSDCTEQNSNKKNNDAKLVSSKWGEVVGVTPTSGLRNGAMVLTVQGFYDYATATTTDNSGSHSFPFSLWGRKVILPNSKTIGIIVGSDGSRPPSSSPQQQPHQKQSENSNNLKHDPSTTLMGICQVVLPNGVASGPSSVQSLLGTRVMLYD